jgi:hypothetical protein
MTIHNSDEVLDETTDKTRQKHKRFHGYRMQEMVQAARELLQNAQKPVSVVILKGGAVLVPIKCGDNQKEDMAVEVHFSDDSNSIEKRGACYFGYEIPNEYELFDSHRKGHCSLWSHASMCVSR